MKWIFSLALIFAALTGTSAAEREADWWSLGPLAKVEVPRLESDWVRTSIDAFVLAKLSEHKLTPSPEADRRTLVRRLAYGLHGLPPTPQEIDAFLNDTSSDAYGDLVDRLLASPRYGERFGRYWLDVVHYGESHGYDKDKPRNHAWPYRDWVISSLNGDKPYDRFVEEQIAGDALYPDDPQATVATGFNAAGPWDFVGHVELREGTVDKDIARSNDRDDMVANTMSTFLSLTVHCARCHDHKFDPIKQDDYYALQAVFAGVDRADREYGVNPQVAHERLRLSSEKARLEADLAKLSKEAKDDSDQQRSQLEQHLRDVNERIAALPKPLIVYATATAKSPRPVYLLARGDVRSPWELVAPGGVACVHGSDPRFALTDPNVESQRRAALARWLTHPSNALLRRSIVNRVWQFHFGQGLVDTPNDFGQMGSLPTHPELLEWLAGWFAEHGHSLKQLHRLLLTSSAYRQASRGNAEYARIDSGNRYLWRMNRARLDAESTRDAMLAVSGKLDLTMGGPSVRQFFFKDDHSPIYDYARFDIDDPASYRRGIYRFLVRSVPDPFMECLDCADASILTPKRNTTLTSMQALSLLNNPLVVRQAEHFALRVRNIDDDLGRQIEAAYLLALGRPPNHRERNELVEYAQQYSLTNACRVILNSNEFVFVD